MNFQIIRRRHWSIWLSFAIATLTVIVLSFRVQGLESNGSITKSIDSASCHFNDIPLYGKVQIVDSFPDLKVKQVESFPDLKVQWVENFPDECGEWQEVNSFPDFTIQYVESFPDLEIETVSSFPGLS